MPITTIQGINYTNFNQTGFYYTLTNNNNGIKVIIQTNTAPLGNNYLEISLDGNRWFQYFLITSSNGNIYDLDGITAIRINPSALSSPFLMQISETATPVQCMGVG